MKGKVVVPQVEEGMFNKRVLVMEYIEGFKVTDRSDTRGMTPGTLDALHCSAVVLVLQAC